MHPGKTSGNRSIRRPTLRSNPDPLNSIPPNDQGTGQHPRGQRDDRTTSNLASCLKCYCSSTPGGRWDIGRVPAPIFQGGVGVVIMTMAIARIYPSISFIEVVH